MDDRRVDSTYHIQFYKCTQCHLVCSESPVPPPPSPWGERQAWASLTDEIQDHRFRDLPTQHPTASCRAYNPGLLILVLCLPTPAMHLCSGSHTLESQVCTRPEGSRGGVSGGEAAYSWDTCSTFMFIIFFPAHQHNGQICEEHLLLPNFCSLMMNKHSLPGASAQAFCSSGLFFVFFLKQVCL